MKKTLLDLALLILIGGGVYFLVFDKSDNPFGESEAAFTVKDTGAIQTIYMVRNSGESILLERKPSGWMLNDKYPALPYSVQTLLGTLYGQSASYPVPDIQHNNVVTSLAGSSVKVEVYGKDKKKMTTFYVGGEGPNGQGTIMLTEGAQKAYIINMPGLTGILNPRYSTNIRDWRDRSMFKVPAKNISSINVSYAFQPLNSYTITQQNGTIELTAKEDISGGKPLNQKRAADYLKFFENINIEGFATDRNLKNIIATVPKFSTMDLTTIDGKKQHLDLYFRPVDQRSKNLLKSNENVPDDYDADRFYAVYNDARDTAVVQYYVFEKLLRKAYEFYEPDAPAKTESAPSVIKISK